MADAAKDYAQLEYLRLSKEIEALQWDADTKEEDRIVVKKYLQRKLAIAARLMNNGITG